MGQYYMICDLDKRELLHPHKMGSGLKLLEMACCNLPRVLVLLLHQSTGGGGGDGDLYHKYVAPYCGRWAGDRLIIVGDYDESEEYGHIYKEMENENIWTDISFDARLAYETWMDWKDCRLGRTWGHEKEWQEFLKSKGIEATYENPDADRDYGKGALRPDFLLRF